MSMTGGEFPKTSTVEGLRDAFQQTLSAEVGHLSRHQNVMLDLPRDAAARKNVPLCRGVLDYFPAALAEVARISKAGNDQHNPGQPIHWARGKSSDHADCIARHLMERGTADPMDGMRHSAKLAWRALALLQEELEAEAGFKPVEAGVWGNIQWGPKFTGTQAPPPSAGRPGPLPAQEPKEFIREIHNW